MTNTIIGLACLGGVIVIFAILQCTFAVAHCRLMQSMRMRGQAIEGEDTVNYRSSGFLGNMWFQFCWKIPINMISYVVCGDDMNAETRV